jgi:nucleoside 2-deoxyribosyltransferase
MTVPLHPRPFAAMSDLFSTLSLAGAVLVLAAYFGVARGLLSSKSVLYHVLNLVGAAMLFVVAIVLGSPGYALLNGSWTLIGLFALWSLWRASRQGTPHSNPTVYLAGPINGCTDEEALGWRSRAATALLPFARPLDPMVRDYRGREHESAAEIVEQDKADIRQSSALLVMAERPTWGTAMEVGFARAEGKYVVAVCSAARPSPWLSYHASVVVHSLDAGIAHLRERFAT